MERSKMSREERAKQFMPFAALKGYPEALHQKEKEICNRNKLQINCDSEKKNRESV